MTSLHKASLEEIRQAAARICRDYLTGRWKEVSAEQLIVKRISGGLSNFLYYVSLPEAATSPADVKNSNNHNHNTNTKNGNNNNNNHTHTCVGGDDGDNARDADAAGAASKRPRTHSGGSATDGAGELSSNGQRHNGHGQQQQQQPLASNTEPQEVLLRIYGQIHGDDALEGMITESVVFALLSERNFGPKLHGVFPGGRIEQYIQARPLATRELAEPRISMKIAEKMGEIHSLNIPMSKEPDWLWNCMARWLNTICGGGGGGGARTGNAANTSFLSRPWPGIDERLVRIVRSFDYAGEAKWLKSVIESDHYPVYFCHNDLQEGNILYRETLADTLRKGSAEGATTAGVPSPRDSLSSLRSNFEDSAIAGLEDVALEGVSDSGAGGGGGATHKRKRSKSDGSTGGGDSAGGNNNNNNINGNSGHSTASDLECTRDSALSSSSHSDLDSDYQLLSAHHSASSGREQDVATSPSPDLIIIDFEYCAYNYRGFDLANHFLEWTLDYNNPEFPFFSHRKNEYPTREQRRDFIAAYLRKLHEEVGGGGGGGSALVGYTPSAGELDRVEEEVRIFSMFSHLFWSLWSVVNVTSNIEFGYWEYAVERIHAYQWWKEAYLQRQPARIDGPQ